MIGGFRERLRSAYDRWSLESELALERAAAYDAIHGEAPVSVRHKLSTHYKRREAARGAQLIKAVSLGALESEAVRLRDGEVSFTTLEKEAAKQLNGLAREAAREKQAIDLAGLQQARTTFMSHQLLSRDARYPDDKVRSAATVLAVWCLETALNSWLLASVSEQGQLGGALAAAALSLPEVGVGVLLGFVALRLQNDVDRNRQVLGMALVVVLVAAAIGWSMFCGYLRAAAESAVVSGSPARLGELHVVSFAVLHPLSLIDDYASLVLVLAGWAGVVVCTFEAYRYSDPVPGFEAVDRPVREASVRQGAIDEALHAGLDQVIVAGNSAIDGTVADIIASDRAMAALCAGIDGAVAGYRGALESEARRIDGVWQRYLELRHAEARGRGLPPVDIPPLRLDARPTEIRVSAARDAIAACRDRALARAETARARLEAMRAEVLRTGCVGDPPPAAAQRALGGEAFGMDMGV